MGCSPVRTTLKYLTHLHSFRPVYTKHAATLILTSMSMHTTAIMLHYLFAISVFFYSHLNEA